MRSVPGAVMERGHPVRLSSKREQSPNEDTMMPVQGFSRNTTARSELRAFSF